MSNFKSVRIDSIEPNRNRNFKLYPVVKEQVKALAESYELTGDFGVIPVRPLEGGGYEMAAGHHRLAAMKKMGLTHADVKVDYHTDDDMARIMMLENSRQQGNNAPAALDSVSTAIERVAYYLLLSDSKEEFFAMFGLDAVKVASKLSTRVKERYAPTDQSFKRTKTQIQSGEPVGYVWLKIFAQDGISDDKSVSSLCRTLQESGVLGKTYKRVQARVNEELAAQEAEEKAAELARVKAERLAEKERLEAQAAAKAAREAAVKAKASQKAAAEAQAKNMERLAKEKAKLRDKEAKRREEERLNADAAREERTRRNAEAKAAADAAKLASKGLDPAVLHMLRAQRHQEAFRKVVTTEEGKKVFPENKQVDVVNKMLAYLGDDIDTNGIKRYLGDVMVKHSQVLRQMMAEREKREEKASVIRKVDNAITEFRLNSSKTAQALMKLAKVLDDDSTRDYANGEIASDPRLSETIDNLENMIGQVRKNLNLYRSHYQTSTFDHEENRETLVSSQ